MFQVSLKNYILHILPLLHEFYLVFLMFWGSYLFMLLPCKLWIILYMCTTDILASISQQYVKMLMFTTALAQIQLETTFCVLFLSMLITFLKKE